MLYTYAEWKDVWSRIKNVTSIELKKGFKYGCFVLLGLGIVFLLCLPIIFKSAFGPKVEMIRIKQQIGGELICNSTYLADIQSWDYLINYHYSPENKEAFTIGHGEFYGREWSREDQIKKIGDWLVLKTGSGYGADKLLIGKKDLTNWKTFEISPTKIKKDSFWLTKEIMVKHNWSPEESFVKQIKENEIIVEYIYRTGERIQEQEKRRLTYRMNDKTGIPEMTKIELIKE